MPTEYDEKRDFIRMITDHDLQYRNLAETAPQPGICKNLSATGILFSAEDAIAEGTQLEITMTPRYSVVAPFVAQVEVIRTESNGSDGSFNIAGKILTMDSA